MDINDLLARRLLQERPRGQDSAQIMALRLQQPQQPGPLLDPGSVWATALSQGLNSFRGSMMSRQADQRADEREERRTAMALNMDEKRGAREAEALGALRQQFGMGGAQTPAQPPMALPGGDVAREPLPPPSAPVAMPAAMYGRNAGLAAVRDANLGADPAQLAALSADRMPAGQPQFNPARPGADAPVPQWDAGLAPPTGRINPGVMPASAPAAMPQAAPAGAPSMEYLGALAQLAARGNRAAAAELQVAQAAMQRGDRLADRADTRAFQQQQLALMAARAQQPDEFGRLLAQAGLQPGSPEAQAAARAILERRGQPPQTTVNVEGAPQVGTIPPGYQLTRDGAALRMEPIPGGPAARQEARDQRADDARRTGTERTGNVVLQDIDRALSLLSRSTLPVAGLGAGTASSIPGTGAADVRSLLDTIRANVGFAQLNQMRQESPTGGALGQVTERELAFLQAVLGNLSQEQSPTQFRRNLERLRETYLEIIHGRQGVPGPAPGLTAQPPAATEDGVIRTPSGITIRPIQ